MLAAMAALALEARERAHAPYSRFKVGAALKTRTGEIVTGCNIENASYGLSMCAERVAVFKAVSEGLAGFDAIAVVAELEAAHPALRSLPADPVGVLRRRRRPHDGPEGPVADHAPRPSSCRCPSTTITCSPRPAEGPRVAAAQAP